MSSINKSLEDLLDELAIIKRQASGRLSSVKNRASTTNEPERIRQTKVSKFVLKRIAELETESLGMRDEMAKLFELQRNKSPAQLAAPIEGRQEDHDFDSEPVATATSTAAAPTTQQLGEGMPSTAATTTLKPDAEEAAAIGFDLEALKRLGEEISKRVDQFGKDAAKNLGDLIEGVKLVFREPAKNQPATAAPKLSFRASRSQTSRLERAATR